MIYSMILSLRIFVLTDEIEQINKFVSFNVIPSLHELVTILETKNSIFLLNLLTINFNKICPLKHLNDVQLFL